MTRPRPEPPRPNLIRKPRPPFGWLEARLLHEGWLARLGPKATALLIFLALAADGHGASFYGRDKMADLLGMDRDDVDRALDRLGELGLVAHRPWNSGHPDGVWQLLPVPPMKPRGPSEPTQIGALLRVIGPDLRPRE